MTDRVREREVIVVDVVRETEDSTTLYLFTGETPLEYKAGQFLTIDSHQFPALERWCLYLEKEKGRKEPVRAYSLASAPREKYVSFTIKETVYYPDETSYPPLLSPILTYRTPLEQARSFELNDSGIYFSHTFGEEHKCYSDHPA